MEHDAVVPVVHAQIAAIALAVLRHLKANDVGGELLPRFEILDAESDIAELGYLDHFVPSVGISYSRDYLLFRADPVGTQRDPPHGVSIGSLMSDFVRRSWSLDHAVGQAAQSGDFDFDQVANVHRARVFRSATEYDVARHQCYETAQIGEYIIDGKE